MGWKQRVVDEYIVVVVFNYQHLWHGALDTKFQRWRVCDKQCEAVRAVAKTAPRVKTTLLSKATHWKMDPDCLVVSN